MGGFLGRSPCLGRRHGGSGPFLLWVSWCLDVTCEHSYGCFPLIPTEVERTWALDASAAALVCGPGVHPDPPSHHLKQDISSLSKPLRVTVFCCLHPKGLGNSVLFPTLDLKLLGFRDSTYFSSSLRAWHTADAQKCEIICICPSEI